MKKYKFISKLKIDNEIQIRQIEESDIDDLYNLINKNRYYLTRWLRYIETTTKEITLEYLKKSILNNKNGVRNLDNRQSLCTCVIFYKDKLVGIINLRSNSDITVEIGYWIDEDYQGKGIAVRTVKYVINYCLNTLNFKRVLIAICVENEKSQNLVEKLNGHSKKEFVEKVVNRGNEDYYFYYFDKVSYFKKRNGNNKV